jgi:acetyl coenzyme A synthetase (ADP forming)-like protein
MTGGDIMTSITTTATTAPAPADRTCDIVLRNGSTLRVRPVRPADAPELLAFHHGLSPQSQYFRFLAFANVTLDAAVRLSNVDGRDDVGLVAETAGAICAVAHYLRNRRTPDRAEVAFAVADLFQGQGVGTKLLERLAAIAREQDVRVFDAMLLSDNRRMLDVLLHSGFEITELLDRGVTRVSLRLDASPGYDARCAARNVEAASASMRIFFEPASVAVIGASRRREQIGGALFHNLRTAGFKGRLVPVNVGTAEVDGVPAFPSILRVPEPIDLAVVAVPADGVDRVVDECLAKGVRGIVIISAGFGETGEAGRAREHALVDKARAAGVRLIGPNCMGLINTDPRVCLNASFGPVYPPGGRVALATQSGALGLAMLEYVRRLNLGISTFVSMGNKADVSGNDLIQYWAGDPRTDVILLYLESFGNPKNFNTIARHVSRQKPIVALKAGRSSLGARAASSHTGALASNDAIVDALFHQTGVIRVDTLEEFFDTATLLAHQPLPRGSRVAILTNAGGPAILAADVCGVQGLQLATLSEVTLRELRAFLPAAASAINPVDMLASASADHYRRAVDLLLADEGVDSVVTIFVPPLVTDPVDVAEAIGAVANSRPGKPLVAAFISARPVPPALAGVPCYAFPESAVRALAQATRYAAWRARPAGTTVPFGDVQIPAARAIAHTVLSRGGGWLTPWEGQALLRTCGIRTAALRLAETVDDVAVAAREIGFPVALKANGPAILHKSDVGGVRLGLTDEAAVVEAAREMQTRLGPALTGFVVQAMAPEGVEMIVGAVHDPAFGHVLSCGTGGVFVELTKDMAFRLHPLTDRDPGEMIDELRGAKLLRGFRGAPVADEGALRDVLLRLSALLDACPEIQELDINPLRVLTNGAVAVDVRVRIDRSEASPGFRRVLY